MLAMSNFSLFIADGANAVAGVLGIEEFLVHWSDLLDYRTHPKVTYR